MLFRVGQGFDIHNLKYQSTDHSQPLILGGVIIAQDIELEAHSDGDALIHALIDSILGALGKEDIGDLFPPTDITYKNMSSIILLTKVLELTGYKNLWEVNNIDIVIVLQEPKLGILKQLIKEKLKEILGLIQDFPLSIKAKTFEEPKNQVWVYSLISIQMKATQ